MYSKILIANRGAIARRIVRACHDLGIGSAVVFTEPDQGAPYLSEAGEAHLIAGQSPLDSYMNTEQLLKVAKDIGADAVHPGYGFLSENADFVRQVHSAGMHFIGPSPDWIERMADKVEARKLMKSAGVPIFPGSGQITSEKEAREFVSENGLPVIVKPSGGGGGIGMKVVFDERELGKAILTASDMAEKSFSNGSVYLERWIADSRHIEFQILADLDGNVMHLFERDCSVQRRNQKLIEEAPAFGIDRAECESLADRLVGTVRKLGYDNLGTIETLRSSSGEYGFLEMNTRIQVEHGVTEEVTGVDLVAAQIRLAAGEGLPEMTDLDGFAIEARVYAEDPVSLMPSTGKLRVFRPPELYGVRVETGVQEGQTISPYYDALLAKVIAKGQTREQAIGRLFVALKAFAIQGVQTNASMLMGIIQHQAFLEGNIDTKFLDKHKII